MPSAPSCRQRLAHQAGVVRASLFRYSGTKEEIVLGRLEESGRRIAEALAARPEGERPWEALRRVFDVLTRMKEQAPEQALSFLRMLQETPLRAGHCEEQLSWQTSAGANEIVPDWGPALTALGTSGRVCWPQPRLPAWMLPRSAGWLARELFLSPRCSIVEWVRWRSGPVCIGAGPEQASSTRDVRCERPSHRTASRPAAGRSAPAPPRP